MYLTNPAHIAWLACHPQRTAEWLQRHLDDGFDVHHIDGQRANNAPDNLVLIETSDHTLRIHGLRMVRNYGPHKPRGRKKTDRALDHAIYKDRQSTGDTWRMIGARFECSGRTAMQRASRHARESGDIWPVVLNLVALYEIARST